MRQVIIYCYIAFASLLFLTEVRATLCCETLSCNTCLPICTECNPGKYCQKDGWSPMIGSVPGVCVDCAAGKYSSTMGAVSMSVCTDCPCGSWQDQPGSTSCISCVKGYFMVDGLPPQFTEQNCDNKCPSGKTTVVISTRG